MEELVEVLIFFEFKAFDCEELPVLLLRTKNLGLMIMMMVFKAGLTILNACVGFPSQSAIEQVDIPIAALREYCMFVNE